ncbi:MAG: hypothetical protein ACPK85_10410, partial [Methanosarcina sp.]
MVIFLDKYSYKYNIINNIFNNFEAKSSINRYLISTILICCFILTNISTAFCITPASIVYVAGDGSGDFNCDGEDDHVQINQALDYAAKNPGTTVHLKGP